MIPSYEDIFGPDEAHAQRVNAEVDRERAKREARRRVDAEERGAAVVPPAIEILRDRLARPREITPVRIDGWMLANQRVLLAAQFKAGKTTLMANAIRSLVDGDPFLDRYDVDPTPGVVALLDFEMSTGQLDDWLRAQRIQNDDRVLVVPLRGRAAAFDILDVDVRAAWARRLRDYGVSVVVLDCVRPAMDALGLDEHRDGGRFLGAVDTLMDEAGITETIVVHHMGHTGERSRGDSRLRDWPDAEWRLMRQDDDPAAARFITAYGRDVDIPETQLMYDGLTRRLSIGSGSRRDAKATDALADVLAVLTDEGKALSGRAIKRAMAESDHGRDVLDAALKYGARTGELLVTEGPRHSKLYLPGSVRVSGSVREVSVDTRDSSVLVSGPLYRGRTDGHSPTRGVDGSPFRFDGKPV